MANGRTCVSMAMSRSGSDPRQVMTSLFGLLGLSLATNWLRKGRRLDRIRLISMCLQESGTKIRNWKELITFLRAVKY